MWYDDPWCPFGCSWVCLADKAGSTPVTVWRCCFQGRSIARLFHSETELKTAQWSHISNRLQTLRLSSYFSDLQALQRRPGPGAATTPLSLRPNVWHDLQATDLPSLIHSQLPWWSFCWASLFQFRVHNIEYQRWWFQIPICVTRFTCLPKVGKWQLCFSFKWLWAVVVHLILHCSGTKLQRPPILVCPGLRYFTGYWASLLKPGHST